MVDKRLGSPALTKNGVTVGKEIASLPFRSGGHFEGRRRLLSARGPGLTASTVPEVSRGRRPAAGSPASRGDSFTRSRGRRRTRVRRNTRRYRSRRRTARTSSPGLGARSCSGPAAGMLPVGDRDRVVPPQEADQAPVRGRDRVALHAVLNHEPGQVPSLGSARHVSRSFPGARPGASGSLPGV
jgi:hypothetical protein